MLYTTINRARLGTVSVPLFSLLAGLTALLSSCSKAPASPSTPAPVAAAVLAEPAQVTLKAGSSIQVLAEADDATGNPIGGAQIRFTPADPKLLRVSDRGLVSSLGPAAQTQLIIASGRAEVRVPVSIEPGEPQRLEKVSGDKQSIRAGEAKFMPLVAHMVDAYGNPIADAPMVVEPVAGMWPTSEVKSSEDGAISIDLPDLNRAGSVEVTLKAKENTSLMVSFGLLITPGTASKITPLTNSPVDSSTAKSLSTIAVKVTDAFDNPVPDVALKAQIAGSDALPPIPKTDATGISEFVLPAQKRAGRLAIEIASVADPLVRTTFAVDASRASAQKSSRSKR